MATFDRDDFWEALAPLLFAPDRLATAALQSRALAQLVGVAPPARVLDLCCGPGAHAIELAQQGFEVTGVDRTAAFLQRAQSMARVAGVDVEWVQGDMREFAREAAFDLAINMDTSFGCLDRDEDDLRVARNLCHSLRPGGAAVVLLDGQEVVRSRFRPRGWREVDQRYFLRESSPSLDWTSIDTRWIVVGAPQPNEFVVRARLYTAHEMVSLFRAAGFASVRVYGNLDGEPYDAFAQHLVMVAVKSCAGA